MKGHNAKYKKSSLLSYEASISAGNTDVVHHMEVTAKFIIMMIIMIFKYWGGSRFWLTLSCTFRLVFR